MYIGKAFSAGGEVGRKFYVEPFGRTVQLMNSRPKNLTEGGLIKWEEGQYNPFTNDLQRDNMIVLLEIGSMVIPRPVIHLFHEFEEQHYKLKQPKITDDHLITEVIVMPEEAIVPRKFVADVKAFLKKNGVELPISKDNLFINEKKYYK
jgi:hypothetical protein